MKKKVFYVTMAAIFAATSCTNELPNEQPTDVINIVASISSQTRAPQLTNDGSGSFSQGDKMSLFLKETDGESHTVDFEYGSGILTWGSLGLSGSNAQISLAACYPQQKDIQDGTFEFNPLTASEKDLLLAPAQSVTAGTSETVHLTFNHALHRLDLTFTAGNSYSDEDLKGLSVALNAKTTCVVDGVLPGSPKHVGCHTDHRHRQRPEVTDLGQTVGATGISAKCSGRRKTLQTDLES